MGEAIALTCALVFAWTGGFLLGLCKGRSLGLRENATTEGEMT